MPEESPSIAARIRKALEGSDRESREPVLDVRMGLAYTAVATRGGLGLAYTLSGAALGGCGCLAGDRPLAGRRVADLLGHLESPNAAEAAVGLAAANAIANRDRPRMVEKDVLEFVRFEPEDAVAMVGHFGPLVAPIEARARTLQILERISKPQGRLLPMEQAADVLAGAQVALITASSLVGGTLDNLLRAAENCREVVLLGASTPLTPEAFAGTPVTCLSGVIVVQPDEVLQVVSEAGGMRHFRPFLRKVNVRLAGGAR